jgi:plasmid maintenance system antidote protein VapI
LIEAKGAAQAEVARAAGIAESTISEVLAGKRDLTRAQIGRLARYFHVTPAVFSFDEESQPAPTHGRRGRRRKALEPV